MSRGHTLGFKLKKHLFHKTETFVFWHMTEISARKWVENDRTDVPHLFGFVKIIRNPENQVQIIRNPKNQVLIKIYGWQFGQNLAWNGSPWLGLGWKWVEMNPTRSRIIFKPIFYIKIQIFILKMPGWGHAGIILQSKCFRSLQTTWNTFGLV